MSADTPRNVVYATQLRLEDYLIHRDGLPFSRSEYNSHPDRFSSRFDQIARHITLFINGIFWAPNSPRTLSNAQLHGVLRELEGASTASQRNRMLQITDVSCDFDGGLEFVKKATTICDPYDYIRSGDRNSSPSTQVVAIGEPTPRRPHCRADRRNTPAEILPSELARDASDQFSTAILPYVRSLLRVDEQKPGSAESRALERATICSGGVLADKHAWLRATLPGSRTPAEAVGRMEVHSPQKVLLLGSG